MARRKLLAMEEFSDELNGEVTPPEELEIVEDGKVEEVEAEHECEIESENALRSLEVGVGLESIYEALAGKVEFTPTEMALVRISTEMAVAGTGLSGSVVLPALEGMAPSIALEGIGEKLGDIIRKVGETIKSIGRSIVNYVKKIIFRMRSYEGKLKTLRALIQERKAAGKKTVKEYKAKFRQSFVADRRKVISSTSELSKEMTKTNKLTTDLSDAVVKHAKVIESDYGMFQLVKDLASVEETGRMFFDHTLDLAQGLIKDLKMKKSGQLRMADEFSTDPMLSGHEIRIQLPSASRNDLKDYAVIKKAGNLFKAEVEDVSEIEDFGPVEFKNVKLSDIEDLITETNSTVSQLVGNFSKLEKILNNGAVALEQSIEAILRTIMAVGVMATAQMANSAQNSLAGNVISSGLTNAERAKLAVKANIGRIIPVTGNLGYSIFKGTVFSYRMLTINNAFLFQTVRSIFFVPGTVIDENILFAHEILTKGQWE